MASENVDSVGSDCGVVQRSLSKWSRTFSACKANLMRYRLFRILRKVVRYGHPLLGYRLCRLQVRREARQDIQRKLERYRLEKSLDEADRTEIETAVETLLTVDGKGQESKRKALQTLLDHSRYNKVRVLSSVAGHKAVKS